MNDRPLSTVVGFVFACIVASCSNTVSGDASAGPPDATADAASDARPPDATMPPDVAAMADTLPPLDQGVDPRRDAASPSPDARDASPDRVPTPPPGPAVCAGVACAVGQACCFATGRCYDPASASECAVPPRTADPRACASNAQCAADEDCEFVASSGRCTGVGTCVARRAPELCGGFGAGVCGCDGRTWPSPCEASQAGVRVAASVPCGTRLYPDPNAHQGCEPAAGCRAGWTCDPTARECVPDRFVAACGTDAECPVGQACCQYAGVCLNAADAELCRPLPEGALLPCRTDADCEPLVPAVAIGGGDYYCAGAGCTGPGGCVRRMRGCTGELAPACGCDGRSYTSPCTAGAQGVRVAHAGMCP